MSISDLYSSGFRDRNKGHFAAIVRVALSDGIITDDEKAFLDRLAGNLDISDSEYENILENPMEYPINPPTFYNARLERLFDLTQMVFADNELGRAPTSYVRTPGCWIRVYTRKCEICGF